MLLLRRYPVLTVLTTAQALYWSCSIIGITLTGLVGQKLSPWPMLATLPLAILVTGCLMAVTPIARWMAKLGARSAMRRGALLGVAGGLICTLAIYAASFTLFCLGILLVGAYQASSGYYRFVALEQVPAEFQGRAAACVVAGGIAAALIAPSIAVQSQHMLGTPIAGAYVAVAVLACMAWAVLGKLPRVQRSSVQPSATNTNAPAAPHPSPVTRRMLWQRPALRHALLLTACGHGLMILVMNATPLAMHQHGHELAASASVIQWHVLGMFLPSLFAGHALDRWGAQRTAALGVAVLFVSAMVALTGEQHMQYLISSLLLGIGWNFMLLSGTRMLTLAYQPHERSVAQPMMEWNNNAVAAAMSLGSGVLVQTLGWQAINLAMLPVLCCMAWWLRPTAHISTPAHPQNGSDSR